MFDRRTEEYYRKRLGINRYGENDLEFIIDDMIKYSIHDYEKFDVEKNLDRCMNKTECINYIFALKRKQYYEHCEESHVYYIDKKISSFSEKTINFITFIKRKMPFFAV